MVWEYILLGDNLASCFKLKLIKFVEQKDVYIAMPLADTAHLLQLLEMFLFSFLFLSIKLLWRKILQEWERKVRVKGISNSFFSSLLK